MIIYTAAKIHAKENDQKFPSAQSVTPNQKEFSSLLPCPPVGILAPCAAATAWSMPIER